jgi:hypothetical protein
MSRDQVDIVLIAASWAGGAGLLGLAGVWLLRRRSVRWLTGAVALVAVAAVVAGMVGTARAMFLSSHDFDVVLLVSLVAGLVALLAGAAVGTAMSGWSHALQDEARRFGESGQFNSSDRGPAEFQGLADELSRTSRRLQGSRDPEARLEES